MRVRRERLDELLLPVRAPGVEAVRGGCAVQDQLSARNRDLVRLVRPLGELGALPTRPKKSP